MKKWKVWLPLANLGLGMLIMATTALWANSLERVASWPNVVIGPVHFFFFDQGSELKQEQTEYFSSEFEENLFQKNADPHLEVVEEQKTRS